MAQIDIEDLEEDHEITSEEMEKAFGGAFGHHRAGGGAW